MKKINIISPYNSIAMQKMTEPLLDYDTEIMSEYRPGADLYYHVPYHTLVGFNKGAREKHIMLYTHMNPTDKSNLLDACERADAIVCMSRKGARELVEIGADIKNLVVIYAGVDPKEITPNDPHDKINIGVVCFEQPNGRKRSHILLDLVWLMDTSNFHFVLAGGGMLEVAQKMRNAGASVSYYEGLSDADMDEFYRALDVFLVTGYIEGGPLTVLEALSFGKKVISSDVGFSHDLLPSAWVYKSLEGLIGIL